MTQLAAVTTAAVARYDFDRVRRDLEEAATIPVVMNIKSKAEAIMAYAGEVRDKDLRVKAMEVRMRAERKLGKLIKEEQGAGRLAVAGSNQHSNGGGSSEDPPQTLRDLDITKRVADRARFMAKPTDQAYERLIEDWREEAQAAKTVKLINPPAQRRARPTPRPEYTPAQIRAICEQSKRVRLLLDAVTACEREAGYSAQTPDSFSPEAKRFAVIRIDVAIERLKGLREVLSS